MKKLLSNIQLKRGSSNYYVFETTALAIVKIFEQCRIMFKRVLKDIMI